MRLSFFLVLGGLGVLGLALVSTNDQRQLAKDETESAIEQTKVPGFTIIGIAARTDNAKESTAKGIIPKQWQKLFSEGMPAKIPDTTGPNLYPLTLTTPATTTASTHM